jgi:phosphoglycolate phosphatase
VLDGGATAGFDLLFFDLDGTLIETAPEIADAVNDTLRERALPPVDEALVASWIGHGTATTLAHALRHAGGAAADAAALAAFGARYEQHYARRCGMRSRPYPQVREVLAALRARGTKLVLLTNKERRFVEPLLAAHGLFDAFDALVCGDTQGTRKPDPAGLLNCLQRFAVPRERALLVGDSRIDVATARAAGVAVWLVAGGYSGGEPPESAAPDRVIADLGALLE